MPSPFPGMDPYLEAPALWTEIHSWLIVQLARSLNPRLAPKYRAAVEQRVYSESLLVGIPDVSISPSPGPTAETLQQSNTTATATRPIRVNVPIPEETTERYLEIRLISTGEVVTVLEILSPKNKRAGEGRNQYLAKRSKILSSLTHLIEIDLLRAGLPMPTSAQTRSDYRILISRANDRPQAELYPLNLPDPLPSFTLPLRTPDPEPLINLQTILTEVYEEAALGLIIDYHKTPPAPNLSPSNQTWIQQHLAAYRIA